MNPPDADRLRPDLERLEDRSLPSSYTQMPVVPTIDAAAAASLEAVLRRGQQEGNRPDVFARAGDSITAAGQFLTPMDVPATWATLAGTPSLLDTLAYFRSGTIGGADSFSRKSTAAVPGWTSAQVLAALPNELAASKPAFVLVMAGTNDIAGGVTVEKFRQNLEDIVRTALDAGVVPVLSTIPDLLYSAALESRVPEINQAIVDVGESLGVPVWNYWRALQPLPGLGISSDRVHPSASPTGGGDLSEFGLQYGYNVRNFTALQTLDKLKRILLWGNTPDLPDSGAAGWQPLSSSVLAVGTDSGAGQQVRIIDAATRQTLFSFDAYPGYGGSVNVTLGDVNGDHIPDLITAPGPGGPPHVEVFDGATGKQLASFYAFDPTLRSGLSVAAGDLNRAGYDDIIVCPQENAPAHVKAFTVGGHIDASFYAFDPAFWGGGRVAAGDVNRDGYDELMVAAGRGGQGHVEVFGGPKLALEASYLAFGPDYMGDVSVAAGDFDGDGRAELAVAMGSGAPPVVAVFRPLDPSPVAAFYAYAPEYLGGVALASVDAGGGRDELVTASCAPDFADVRAYDGARGTLLDAIPLYEVGVRRGVSIGG